MVRNILVKWNKNLKKRGEYIPEKPIFYGAGGEGRKKIVANWYQIGYNEEGFKLANRPADGRSAIPRRQQAGGASQRVGRACLMTAPKARGLGREEMEGDIPQWKPRKRAD